MHAHTWASYMPVVTGHVVLYGEHVWPEELSCVRTGTYSMHASVNTHTRTHTYTFLHVHVHTQVHSLKVNSSETREDRPLCVQLTEWITRWAKTLPSCPTQQYWMAFRWISPNLVQTVSQYRGNGQSFRGNNSQVICRENVCLGHFAPHSVTHP